MSEPVRLLTFAGATRTQSLNRRLALLAFRIAEANGIASTLAELRDYPMPLYDGDLEAAQGVPENARRFRDLMAAHDGILIVSPEYNASVTPLLKNTIDWVSRIKPTPERPDVFRSRPFAICGASPGRFGAMRALLTLRQVLAVGLGALVLPRQVALSQANAAFDEQGHLKDKAVQDQLKKTVEELAAMAARLKA
jgi:chromate reductase